MPTDPSFLGTGWSFPPTFTRGGAEVDLVSGADDIEQSLQILLSTRLGERLMQPDFGCDLQQVMFEHRRRETQASDALAATGRRQEEQIVHSFDTFGEMLHQAIFQVTLGQINLEDRRNFTAGIGFWFEPIEQPDFVLFLGCRLVDERKPTLLGEDP